MRLLLTALLAAIAALLPTAAASDAAEYSGGHGYSYSYSYSHSYGPPPPRRPPSYDGYHWDYYRPPPPRPPREAYPPPRPYPPGNPYDWPGGYDPRPDPDDRQACRAERASFAIGRRYDAALAEQARRAAGAGVVRPIRPGMAYTREYRADRLNLDLDRRGRVQAVNCG